jgi:ATP-dependent Clp protease ATP-binding subunit ClpB
VSERNITVRFTDDTKKFIAKETYSPAYGARPIKRYLQKTIETEIATKIIRGEVKDGDDFTIDASSL